MKLLRFIPLLLAFVALPFATFAALKEKPAKPLHISQGNEVKLEDYLVPGKITVFDFYSEYCAPCMALAPELDKLHAKRPDVVVIKVDINRAGVKGIDFKSPVVAQYKLSSIPHFKVFGPDGKLRAEDTQTEDKGYDLVMTWLK
jgi:thiol-disulfide isomerase/thioredoxin